MYRRCAHFGASRSPRGKTEDFFFGEARRCLTSLTGAELVSCATSPAAAATDGAAWLAIWVRPLLCVATRTPCSSPPPTKLPHDIVWCLACSLNVLNLGGACSGVSTVACVGKILGEQNFKAAHTYSSALRRRLASSSCARSRAHHQLAASGGYVIFTDTKLCSITVPTFFMGEQVKQKP